MCRKTINNFRKVVCNGEKVFNNALLIGTGVRTISFSSWPQEVYYFRGLGAESTIADLGSCTPPRCLCRGGL
jgi:hypothetical protein